MISKSSKRLVGLVSVLFGLLLLPGTGLAQSGGLSVGDIGRGNSFGQGFDQSLQKAVVKEVPLVALKDAQVIMANYKELSRLGVKTDPHGARWGKTDRDLVNTFAFRPATEQEIRDKAYTHIGVATRYADAYGDGGVKGDGRAALTGEVIIKNLKGGIVGVYDIQVKGVGTGLHPNWKGFAHRHGKESLRQALEDALFSDYLTRNGIRTNSWLAVIDTKSDIVHPDGGRERAGLLVRGGNFLRMAHFNLVRNDPKQLRQLVDFANKQVSLEMGRNRPLSIPGLYKVLTQRKAREVADLYFLRTVHGSTTYDNIGIMENMDHGTASTVNRTHRNYSFFSKWVGYGGEPKFVMNEYYHKELYDLLMSAASPAEKKALQKLNPARITQGMLEHRMTYDALLHSGLSEGDARKVMKKGRGAATRFAKTLLTLANEQEIGKTAIMGKSTQVKDPARYDMFGALNKLAELQVIYKKPDARAKTLVRFLRPDGKVSGADLAAARKLVDAFDKVISPVLSRQPREVRVGMVRLMRERAAVRNEHAVHLVRQDLRDYAVKMTDRIQKGEDLDAVRADLHAFRRKNVLLGPGSSVYAANRVIAGKAPRTGDGYMVLTRHHENGVSIKEVSNGQQDKIRVSIAGDPLKLGELGRYRMHFSVGGEWRDLSPVQVEGGKAVFEVPVTPGQAPGSILAAFFDAHNRDGRWWNNSGRNFGTNVKLVLGSEDVQTALHLAARRRGVTRGGRIRSSLKAVSLGLYRDERSRAASRGKKKTGKTLPRRLTRSQRALGRALQGTTSAARFHTFKLKPRRAPRAPVRRVLGRFKNRVGGRQNAARAQGVRARGQRGQGHGAFGPRP